jgi:hypothetical protein
VVIGTAVVAENTRSEFHTIGGVMIGVGALSLISTIKDRVGISRPNLNYVSGIKE